ncbi:hypothetical protein [Arthrobacter sp. zg-Y238]|uniref:hypothetical protein n=1 Tax=Arthrobacter sp. zg-Y238 TaxID=2964614 RepID=UPI002105BACD|nr:hypothetical protein [Arthrobacter sp. zg-Y238]MCQ1954407.1 hypothetical protein [Arthrobacter sp. zg-Y238]
MKGSGWFARLRAQPGFRAAAVAFVLTVILGVGGPAAYAYWTQSTAVTVTGTTAPPVTPVPKGVKCQPSPVRITWPAAAGADPEVRYIVSLNAEAVGLSAVYALPAGTTTIDPWTVYAAHTGGAAPRSMSTTIKVTATVRSAIVQPYVSASMVKVADTDLRYVSAPSETVKMNVAVSTLSLTCG